jgi:hypothetical protein
LIVDVIKSEIRNKMIGIITSKYNWREYLKFKAATTNSHAVGDPFLVACHHPLPPFASGTARQPYENVTKGFSCNVSMKQSKSFVFC